MPCPRDARRTRRGPAPLAAAGERRGDEPAAPALAHGQRGGSAAAAAGTYLLGREVLCFPGSTPGHFSRLPALRPRSRPPSRFPNSEAGGRGPEVSNPQNGCHGALEPRARGAGLVPAPGRARPAAELPICGRQLLFYFHPVLSPRPYSLTDCRGFSRAAGGRLKLRRGKGERSGGESAVTSGGAEDAPGSFPAGCSLRGRGRSGPGQRGAEKGPLRAALRGVRGSGRRDGPGPAGGSSGAAAPRESLGAAPGRHRGPAVRRPTWEGGSSRRSDCPVKSVGCWHNSRAFGRARSC